ncbi:DUF4097 family beta strand repeat-containing protein [Paenibacillus dauci]|uniref:DUF4097 family beta strand repeat-containing protein n=1 Tax=Paenibacillus dauci TaxID=1567106 RepID=UPI000619DC76|nr:DUF4097 family beta strand repeat-containing protein [Paenibacillus dauci]
MPTKIRVGRITASLLWLVLGVLVFLDQWTGGGQLLWLLTWWPVILVVWGIEYIIFYILSRRRLFRLRMDIRGMLIALLAAVSIFLVTEQNQYLYLWSRVSLDLTAASAEFSEASGTRTELDSLAVPITEETDELNVEGINGDLIIHSGSVDQIQIRPVVWVDEVQREKAKKIALSTKINFTEGQDIDIRPETTSYGESSNRQPRVNMEITVPASRHFDINVQTTNGKITMNGIEALRSISVRSGNGGLVLRDLLGDVKAQTTNGNMEITSILGNVNAETNQGTFRVNDISGAAKLYTQVGDVSLTGGLGDIDVNTRNGNIFVDEANFETRAETLNGNIEVRSVSIGGDWSVYSAVGVINLYLPAAGNYEISGSNSYGTIKTDLPLEVKNKAVSGTFGTADHTIRVDGNGDLNILHNTDSMIQDNDQQRVVPSTGQKEPSDTAGTKTDAADKTADPSAAKKTTEPVPEPSGNSSTDK